MLSDMQQYYLHQMNIEVWTLRDKKGASTISLLTQLENQVAHCQRCPLHQTRTQTVFARGNTQAKLMIIGEAPGFYEDKQGLPFVGKAGFLLNNMLQSVGIDPDEVYIANVLKCRPPQNRDPQPEEITQCRDFLSEQIKLVQPKLILAVGRFAGQLLSQSTAPMYKLRQRTHEYQAIPVIVSFHPAYLLRNPKDKKLAYADLLLVRQKITAYES